MPIQFPCPRCGKVYQVNDEHAGKRIKCKACETIIPVPGASGPKSAPASSKAPRPAPTPPPDLFGLDELADGDKGEPVATLQPVRGRSRSSSSSGDNSYTILFVMGGVGLIVVLIIVGLLFLVGPSSQKKGPKVARNRDSGESASASSGSSGSEAPGADSRFTSGGAKAASLALWQVKIDPAPADQNVAISPETFRAIKVPEAYASPDSSVIFPRTPSPFVCLGGNDADSQKREVYDLRNGNVVGRLMGKIDLHDPIALSPDGRYLAGHTHSQPRATVIWSVADARMLGSIKEEETPPDIIEFAGPTQLLITSGSSDKAELWDFQAGNQGRSISL